MTDKKQTKNASNESTHALIIIFAFIAWCMIPPSKNDESSGVKWFIYLSMLACAAGMVYYTFFHS